jgi:hypothetical protein
MIDTIEKLLQDYASYSFMEGTIDEDTMNHLVEDAQNYVAKLNELNLLSLHSVSGSFTLDDMRRAFEGGTDSIEAELKCERYGDMDFYASKKIVKSFKTFIYENYR